MQAAAYYVALLSIVTIPPVLGFWFFVHPFTELWRRLGLHMYCSFVVSYFSLFMWAMYLVSEPLLRIHYEVRIPLVIIAAFLLLISIWIGIWRQRHLKISVLLGVPQIMTGKHRSRLITEGIYSHVRNPRYLEMGFGIAALALFSNYFAVYVLLAAYIPVIYIVVLLEEKELTERFGSTYREYCLKVPRFLPKFDKIRNKEAA